MGESAHPPEARPRGSGTDSMENPWKRGPLASRWVPLPTASNPLRDDQCRLILTLIAARPPRRVLDLGCGPGALAEAILRRFQDTRVVGVDISSVSLARARDSLSRYGRRVRLVECPLEEDWTAQANGSFDLAIAVQSLHHVDGGQKQRVLRRVYAALEPGGLFILSDRIELFEEETFELYVAVENLARTARGFPPMQPGFCRETYLAAHGPRGDRPDTVEFHLEGMREAGFKAECLWRYGVRAILIGLR